MHGFRPVDPDNRILSKAYSDSLKIRGLDLFCGAGGAARGYIDAGVDSIDGVDHHTQNRFLEGVRGQGWFHKRDALEALSDENFVRQYDFLHLSPPCQVFSSTKQIGGKNHNQSGKVDLLTPVLKIIESRYSDMLIVVENVEKAPLEHPIHQCLKLCGSMFPGLHSCYDTRRQLRRHRKFRLYNFRMSALTCQHNGFRAIGVFGAAGDVLPGNGGDVARDLKEGSCLMGIDWMNWRELREAIPPAYTCYIGKFLIDAVASRRKQRNKKS